MSSRRLKRPKTNLPCNRMLTVQSAAGTHEELVDRCVKPQILYDIWKIVARVHVLGTEIGYNLTPSVISEGKWRCEFRSIHGKFETCALLADNSIHYTRWGTLHLFNIKRLKTQHPSLSKPIYDGQFVETSRKRLFCICHRSRWGEEDQNVERRWWGCRYDPEWTCIE